MRFNTLVKILLESKNVDAWLDPHLNLHNLERDEPHDEWAANYLGNENDLRGDSAQELINAGWIRVVRVPGYLYFSGAPSPKQRKELKDIAIEELRDLMDPDDYI